MIQDTLVPAKPTPAARTEFSPRKVQSPPSPKRIRTAMHTQTKTETSRGAWHASRGVLPQGCIISRGRGAAMGRSFSVGERQLLWRRAERRQGDGDTCSAIRGGRRGGGSLMSCRQRPARTSCRADSAAVPGKWGYVVRLVAPAVTEPGALARAESPVSKW
jgi:hypothetical protein